MKLSLTSGAVIAATAYAASTAQRVELDQPNMAAYWCTPGTCFSQSGDINSINPAATDALLAFATVSVSGAISFPESKTTVEQLQAKEMKVSISLGGENQNPDYILDNQNIVVAGLLFGTFFLLIVIPVAYYYLGRFKSVSHKSPQT